MKIIIIDDVKILADMFACFAVKAGGHIVTTFYDSEDAIQYLKSSADYDLVITDYTMPKFTGIDVAKAAQSNKPTPVILMSGSVDYVEDISKNWHVFSRVLAKPVSYEQFKQVISEHLPL